MTALALFAERFIDYTFSNWIMMPLLALDTTAIGYVLLKVLL